MLCGSEEAETAQSSSAMKAQFNFFTLGEDRQLILLLGSRKTQSQLTLCSAQNVMRQPVKGAGAWMGVGQGLSCISEPSVLPKFCPKRRQREEEEQGFPSSSSLLQNQPWKSTQTRNKPENISTTFSPGTRKQKSTPQRLP